MPKRSSKPKKDFAQLAFSIYQQAIGEKEEKTDPPKAQAKNPAAVALGRLGGKKGGPARAEALSANKRKEIAKKAAAARWDKKK